MSILSNDITLDSQRYRLARQELIRRAGLTARAWQEKHIPVATKRVARSNVRPGDIPGEYIITYDDWSKGVTGERNPLPGTVHVCVGMDPTTPGALVQMGTVQTFVDASTLSGISAAKVVQFASAVFACFGRYVYKISDNTAAQDKDFGAGYTATDVIVFDNELVVCFGGTTNKIQKRNTAGTWTAATDATYADYFALVQNRLWRATATSQVSNIAPTDNPLTLANWSSGITVGDNNVSITQLNGYGEKLAVSKEDGLYLGDASTIFPNVLDDIKSIRDPNNGRGTIKHGSQLLYPYQSGGLKVYEPGSSLDSGIRGQLTSIDLTDPRGLIPGYHITALASQGRYVWAVTEPLPYPQALPTGVMVTINNGVAYTSYLTDTTDSQNTTGAILNSLDTVVNGDWLIIGYSAAFYGFYMDFLAPNSNASVMTVEYWNGSAWTAMTGANLPHDHTTVSGVTMARSGMVIWTGDPTGWVASTINSVNAFWVRVSVSAALDSVVQMRECRIVTQPPQAYVYRGRPATRGDEFSNALIWEPMARFQSAGITRAALAVGPEYRTYRRSNTLLIADADRIQLFPLSVGKLDFPQDTKELVRVVLPKDDAGMPEIVKQWLDIAIKGRTIDATRNVDLDYRLDEVSAWSTGQVDIAASPTTVSLSGVSGRALQLYLAGPGALHYETPLEINEIEVRFREKPTLKRSYQMTLQVEDGQGDGIAAPDVQLTNLLALQAGAPVVLVDPTGREKTVMVSDVNVAELVQDQLDHPALLVSVLATEI